MEIEPRYIFVANLARLRRYMSIVGFGRDKLAAVIAPDIITDIECLIWGSIQFIFTSKLTWVQQAWCKRTEVVLDVKNLLLMN